MANENKKNTELVADDDDPTSELELLTLQQVPDSVDDPVATESDANTFNFDRPSAQSETIERLQFDIEQLRARWTGLETEIKAREELTSKLHSELNTKTHALSRKDKLISKRDRAIKSLKAEIRERNKEFGELRDNLDELRSQNQQLRASDEIAKAKQQIDAQAGSLTSIQAALKETEEQQMRTEDYADKLRRQLNDLSGSLESASSEREGLRAALEEAQDDRRALSSKLTAANEQTKLLGDRLDGLEAAHTEEIRVLRFELGEAEQTLAENEHISEELASDLVDTRTFRDGLERLLEEEREKSSKTLQKLRKKIKNLEATVADYEEKLESKSDAVNCLIAELAKKSQEIDSISDIEEVIHEIDDRMSERIDERPAPERDRITRLLIGRVDDQELRFPLFKDRLTIGRTQQNDIQLKAQYISRRHAVITTEGDAARVVDWGSKNGVYVNSKRISEHFLKNGDLVTIGIAEFRYEELPKRDM
jgi:chromosome segregation ATPase